MEETFAAGDLVFLIHLKEEAEVTRLNGADMVYVNVDGMEIPVYKSDITKNIPQRREEIKEAQVENKIQFREIKEKKEEVITKSDSGIFISFEPVKDKEGNIEKFRISLANDTAFPVSFRYWLNLAGQTNFKMEKIALPYQVFLLHEIEYDALNEMPVVELQVRDIMNENFSGVLYQKIRPQNFFNKLGKMPLTEMEAYIYKAELTPFTKKQEKKEPQTKVEFDPDVLRHLMMDTAVNKDAEVGSAVGEIDLHIEALTKDHYGMGNSEMIHLQLGKFQQTLERAIAGGIDKFYVIHGIGSGKLKKEIHRILRNYKEVKSFNNDFHPKYGYGATEIILK